MAVTPEEVAALHAMLAGDFETSERLRTSLDPVATGRSYTALVAAAFVEAASRRFTANSTDDDVIAFVADVRSRSENIARDLDPRAAERMLLAVFTDESIDDIDGTTLTRTQLLLLSALIADEQLTEPGLDAFVDDAAKLANEWLA